MRFAQPQVITPGIWSQFPERAALGQFGANSIPTGTCNEQYCHHPCHAQSQEGVGPVRLLSPKYVSQIQLDPAYSFSVGMSQIWLPVDSDVQK